MSGMSLEEGTRPAQPPPPGKLPASLSPAITRSPALPWLRRQEGSPVLTLLLQLQFSMSELVVRTWEVYFLPLLKGKPMVLVLSRDPHRLKSLSTDDVHPQVQDTESRQLIINKYST